MGINKEESGHLSNPFSRFRICHHNEVPRLEVCREDLAGWVCPGRYGWIVGILISLEYPL
jgi:hypothetical protein